jgi:hypothetical protein
LVSFLSEALHNFLSVVRARELGERRLEFGVVDESLAVCGLLPVLLSPVNPPVKTAITLNGGFAPLLVEELFHDLLSKFLPQFLDELVVAHNSLLVLVQLFGPDIADANKCFPRLVLI